MRALLFAIPLALAGCMSPAERALSDLETCRDFGFRDATPSMAECRLKLASDRENRHRAAINSIADQNAAAMRANSPPKLCQVGPTGYLVCF